MAMWDALGDVPGFVWALALLILVAYVVIKREVDIVARQLRRQALKRGGSVKMSLVYYPRLTFRDGGVDILVSAFFGTKRSSPSTFAEFTLPGLRQYGFRIDRPGTPTGRSPYPAARTGDATFDEAFQVHATDEPFLRRVLTPEVQADLLEYPGQNQEVSVKVTEAWPGRPEHEGRLWVSVKRIAKTEQEYERLIDTTILFCHRVKDVLNDSQRAKQIGD